ncbi:MAG: hypothetical protein FJ264_15305 [Planctomycetes bacterium]|nr:hypothetical protein [Planctomycetota bacterium]
MKIVKNFLETLDPRTKIISSFFIISCMALTPISRIKDFGVYFLFIVAISLFSDISPARILRRLRNALCPIVIFPVLILIILFSGKLFVCYFFKVGASVSNILKDEAWFFLFFMIKLDLSLILIAVVLSMISYTDFLRGLEKLYIPQAGVLSALYHIFQVINTMKRLIRFEIYHFLGGKYRKTIRKYTHPVNKLLDKILSSPEKDSSVKLMCTGEEMCGATSLRFSYRDFLFILGVIALLICIISGVIYKIEDIKINNIHVWKNLSI